MKHLNALCWLLAVLGIVAIVLGCLWMAGLLFGMALDHGAWTDALHPLYLIVGGVIVGGLFYYLAERTDRFPFTDRYYRR